MGKSLIKKKLLLCIILVLFISCSTLPELDSLDPSRTAEIIKKCSDPFLQEKWRTIHSIEAGMPGGGKGSIIGITVASPKTDTIHSVIMTIEGFVLFDGSYDKEVIINRGIEPFNSIHFAKGLMDDIKLIYFKPKGRLIKVGIINNTYVCRHKDDGSIIDIVFKGENNWEINKYNDSNKLLRSVKITNLKNGIPEKIELYGYEVLGYSLILNLIEAERVYK